jgi:hypothetical protein
MDQTELQLLEKLAPEHPDLQTLWQEHILYKKQIEKLESKGYRTPEEDISLRQLKKQKLDAKTKMVALLDEYK